MRIVNLSDDRKPSKDLIKEHGLSFYMETEYKKYLFDTGASEVFIRNAHSLGINLRDVDAVIISHNHYDHISGLEFFFEINKKAKVYIKEDSLYETFYMRTLYECPLGKFHDNLASNNRIVFIKDNFQLDKNLYLVSDIKGNKDVFSQGTQFYIRKNGEVYPDEFTHEMFIVYLRDNMSNILTACSHRGIINIIETVKEKFKLPINKVIGGMHLAALAGTTINCSEKYYFHLADYLSEAEIEKIHTCHCTGKFAYDLLKRDLKRKIDYFFLGDEIII